MTRSFTLGSALGLTLLALPALADDRADCTAGIAMIRSEIARQAPPATLAALQRALRDAERELKEAELDECLDAIEDARKALSR